MCLQYEHQRRTKRDEAGEKEADIVAFKAVSALANLKLRYSRLALCFSMVAMLVGEPAGISPERVREMCQIVPSERWDHAAQRDSSGKASVLVPQILEAYEEFLTLVSGKTTILGRLRDPDERRSLRDRASRFGDLVFELLNHVAVSDEQFRRLVV